MRTRSAMIGIDTNVLLRLLVRDDEAQVRAAERFIATHCSPDSPGFVSLVVVVETAWALRRFYLYDRSQIAAALGSLLDVAELEIESAAEVRSAVADFGWLRLDGTLAWLMWGLIHVSFLIGFRNRLIVMLDWIWSYFTFQSGARLITGPNQE